MSCLDLASACMGSAVPAVQSAYVPARRTASACNAVHQLSNSPSPSCLFPCFRRYYEQADKDKERYNKEQAAYNKDSKDAKPEKKETKKKETKPKGKAKGKAKEEEEDDEGEKDASADDDEDDE